MERPRAFCYGDFMDGMRAILGRRGEPVKLALKNNDVLLITAQSVYYACNRQALPGTR